MHKIRIGFRLNFWQDVRFWKASKFDKIQYISQLTSFLLFDHIINGEFKNG